jgi:dipeptidyl aminopeptidase/acylaminoacyl peptidase
MTRFTLLTVVLLWPAAPLVARAPAKRPITHADYVSWRSIQGETLSPDGRYLAYALAPQEGDGEFVVRDLPSGREWRHTRGYRIAVPVSAAARLARGGPVPGASPIQFSPDGKFVLFPIYPSKADRDRAKKERIPDASLRNALGIMELPSGKVTRLERVRQFHVPTLLPPGGAGACCVYQREPTQTVRPAGPATSPEPRPNPGSDLVLRYPGSGRERIFAGVTEYTLSKDGQVLVYALTEIGNGGVYAVNTATDDAPVALAVGPGRSLKLTWDDRQSQLAFLLLPSPSGRAQVRLWTRPEALRPAAPLLPWCPAGTLGSLALATLHSRTGGKTIDLTQGARTVLQPTWAVSEHGGLSFALDGTRLHVGVAPPAKPAPTGEEKAVVELWHYNDDFIQPMQKVRHEQERLRTYPAVIYPADRTFRQLGDEMLPEVRPAPAGDLALGVDDRPYRILVGREAQAASDIYLLNMRNGDRRLILKKQSWPFSWSPMGRFVVFYDGKDWHSLATATGERVNLTGRLGVSFADEDHDTPSAPPPYGLAGWSADDRQVLVYDRHDLWALTPDGKSARNLTAGLGRKTSTRLRLVSLDPEERSIDLTRPLLVRSENEDTRETGFYQVSVGGGSPRPLIRGPRNYGTPVKARKADTLLLSVSTFSDFPDLHVSDPEFRDLRRVTDANPQKESLLWGKAELVRYRNADGVPLQGVLIRPENFTPGRKYPLLVYIYERLSDHLHHFVSPGPGTSINPTYYASNGYLVLMPDITYTTGYPGQSALKCVLPAIQAVVDQGCVKEDAIGIQGHSWGGYQTAFLVTQTTRFRAAAAGAPVANMTSAYGGVRWGTGLSRQFQYEQSQSRIGGTPWQYPTRFLENSPLFSVDRVKTPLLMLHNDRDEAVPWQQGIEYYLALRRLGKEAYLFNYPGEGHGLRQRVNQADYTTRMQQFFDHHLKGAPKPEWMEKGIPYTPAPADRGRTAR